MCTLNITEIKKRRHLLSQYWLSFIVEDMGGDKDAKGDGGRAKHKTPKLKPLSDDESAGTGGDATKKNRCVCVCVV